MYENLKCVDVEFMSIISNLQLKKPGPRSPLYIVIAVTIATEGKITNLYSMYIFWILQFGCYVNILNLFTRNAYTFTTLRYMRTL